MQRKKQEEYHTQGRSLFVRIVAAVCAVLIAGSAIAIAFSI